MPNKDLCPCESGKLLRACCIDSNNTFRTTPANLLPPAPKTGLANPGCYASQLADCCDALSREHFISHAILKWLSHDGLVTVDGFNFQQKDDVQELPTPSLASRILCKRHNEALSGLDAVASRLFQKFDNVVRQRERRDRVFLFDGGDFERWLLKTLCGAVFSRNAHTRAVSADWRPSLSWLEILFGLAPFPDRCGLYFAGENADVIEAGFKMRTLSNDIAGVYGARISFDDELFLFLMETPPIDLRGTYLARYLYRPQEIVLASKDCENVIRFGWNDRFDHHTCVIKYEKG